MTLSDGSPAVTDAVNEVKRRGFLARSAAAVMGTSSRADRDSALMRAASSIEARSREILVANDKDLAAFSGSDALRDRLLLNERRVREMAESMRAIVSLPDPVGEVIESWTTTTGLQIKRIRVPFGVIAVIYEARPNVTAEVTALALRSGNSIILRGGSEAINSNKAIVKVIRAAIADSVPEDGVQLVENTDRSGVKAILSAEGLIDLVVPRGSAEFIRYVRDNAKVPFIETGAGNNHIFVDKGADLEMATRVIINAKVQRPSVCNAVRKLLIHQDLAAAYVPTIVARLWGSGVRVKGCDRVMNITPDVEEATEDDWQKEYMDLTIAIKVVGSLKEATEHINRYGSKHSEAIITGDPSAAAEFTSLVDASTVLVNASTRLVDGGVFGFGTEVGISTQKLHSRGPMGLRDLTTTKFVVTGNGQIRE